MYFGAFELCLMFLFMFGSAPLAFISLFACKIQIKVFCLVEV